MATLFGRAQMGVRNPGSGQLQARTWEDHQHYLVSDDRSDAPRVPRHDLQKLFPTGAPRSWLLVVERPRRAPWVLRAAAAVISIGLGLATVASQAVAGGVAGIFSVAGELFTIGLHLVVFLASDGRFGFVGRLIGAAALVGALARLGWQLARWSSAPIGSDR